MKANYILITTFTFLGLFHEYAMSQTKQSSQVDADPASKIKCEKIWLHDHRIEINYWTIRSIDKNKVLLDFGRHLRFPCENYKENIFAFSESGEIVPLKFVKVIPPQMTYQWYSKKESKICHCMSKDEHLYGFCDQLEGDGTYGLDVEKTKCRYIAEYTFDPKFKLKAKTLAIHLPDVQNTKYEHFKMTPLLASSPEGKAFTEKKFYKPRKSNEAEAYTTYYPSKTRCMNISNCNVFAYRPTGWTMPSEQGQEEYRVYPFGECYLIITIETWGWGGGGVSCQDKKVCTVRGRGDYQQKIPIQIQGKLTFGKDRRELYIFYYQSGWYDMSHVLFDPKLHGFGAAVSYDNEEPCKLTFYWLEIKEAEAKKAAQGASTSGSGSGEAKAGQ